MDSDESIRTTVGMIAISSFLYDEQTPQVSVLNKTMRYTLANDRGMEMNTKSVLWHNKKMLYLKAQV